MPRLTGDDRGSVTAETAVLLPSLVLLLAFGMWALACGIGQIQAVDAARSAARALARGEPQERVVEAALRAAPDQAEVSVRPDAEHTSVLVTARVAPPGPLARLLPAFTVSARATAANEPDASGGVP